MINIAWGDNGQGSFLGGMLVFSIIWMNARTTARGTTQAGFAVVIRGAESLTLPGRYETVHAARESQEAETWLNREIELRRGDL